MSYLTTCILADIKRTLDQIESTVYAFQSQHSKTLTPINIDVSFNIASLYAQTKNIHDWAVANGACADITHTNGNIIAKWSAIIDDLHWTLFGSDMMMSLQGKNKLHIVYFKLMYILKNLATPSPECY